MNCAPSSTRARTCRWASAWIRRICFAAGWDIRTEAGLEKALLDIDSSVGLDRVRLIHANDSKTPLGSRVDRHEHIGKGKIGLEAFGRILNHPVLAGRAFIAETPDR